MLVATLVVTSCATTPPVQEMSEARSAIESARQLGQDKSGQDKPEQKSSKANLEIKSAEQSLQEAADAIDKKYYDLARRKAIEAKRKAQRAARMKRNSSQ